MKKLLSLILTLALMSTMLVFGGASASAAAATTTVTETYTTPDVMFARYATAEDGTITQTVSALTSNEKINTAEYEDTRDWVYMRFKVGSFERVSGVTFNLNARYNAGGTFYVRELGTEEWEKAVKAMDNATVLTGEDMLSVPDGNIMDGVKFSTMDTARVIPFNGTETLITLYKKDDTTAVTGNSFGGSLVSHVENCAKTDEKYVHMAITFIDSNGASKANTKYGTVITESTSLEVTGERAVEGGIGTKIIAEKTARINLNGEGNIAHVVKGTEGNQYTEKGTYSVNNCEISGTEYVKYLYLRADLSEFADKEVAEVKLNVNGRKFSNSFTLYACETKNDWNITTISFDNQPEKISGKQAEFTGFEGYSSYYDASADVTSFVDDLATDSMLSIMLELDCGTKTNANGCTIKNVGGSYEDETKAPHLVITYLDEIDTDTDGIPAGETFTFKGEIAVTGTPVMLLVGIYGENNALIDVVSSGVLTNGTNELKVDVDLANYPTATSIKGFFWNGTTLAPFMDPTPARVVAAA